MKVLSYIRVSTDEQKTEKNKAAVLQYARNNGFGEDVEFYTEHVSGTVPWQERKLKTVVEALKRGDVLIVPELSRLGRSTVEILSVLNTLSHTGVRVYSVKEGFQLNGNDMQSKMMRTFLATFAEVERDLLSQRTREGMAAAKQKGKQFGRPQQFTPEVTRQGPEARKLKAAQNKANRHAWHFIKPLREQGLSYTKIANRLNDEGYKTRTGKQFKAPQVRNIYQRFNTEANQ